MNTNHIDKKIVLLVVGEAQDRQSRMIEKLKEHYGDQLEIVTQTEFEKIEGMSIDYMIMDEALKINEHHDIVKPFREKPIWQKANRWG